MEFSLPSFIGNLRKNKIKNETNISSHGYWGLLKEALEFSLPPFYWNCKNEKEKKMKIVQLDVKAAFYPRALLLGGWIKLLRGSPLTKSSWGKNIPVRNIRIKSLRWKRLSIRNLRRKDDSILKVGVGDWQK